MRTDRDTSRVPLPAPPPVSAVLAGLGELLFRPGLRAVVFETRADLLANPNRCPAASQLLAAGFELHALLRSEDSSHLLGNFLATRPT